MTDTKHDDRNAYLWDRSAPVDADAAEIERALGVLAFTPGETPSSFHRRIDRGYRWPRALALAASVLLAIAAGLYFWRLSWPENRPWPVTGAATSSLLAVGDTLETQPAENATIDIARIGRLSMRGDTSVSLDQTTSRRHRLDMSRGSIDVRVWAPPGRFAVHTPAGDVIDLGCIFRLDVDGNTVRLQVQTGWVQLDNTQGESLIPAGAWSSMSAGRAPLVPVYNDAHVEFTSAVRQWEQADNATARAGVVSMITTRARTRDMLTLLMLTVRSTGTDRAAFVNRAAQLFPPPSEVSTTDILAGNNEPVWRWRGALPLPPAKAWWRNWADAFGK